MTGLSLESPCIWCAGPLTLCSEDRCCEECDHPYQINQLIKAIERGPGLDVDVLFTAIENVGRTDVDGGMLGSDHVEFRAVSRWDAPKITAEYARLTEAKPETPA